MTKTLSIAALCTTLLAGCAIGPQPQTTTYGSGETKENYSIENGQKNGPYTKYFMSGVLKEEGSYKDGQIDGFMTTYHENGNKAEVAQLQMGSYIENKSTYDENGNLVFTGPVNSQGRFDGLVLQYGTKGVKQYRSHYKNGVLDGTTQAFNGDGKVSLSYEFVDGILQSLITRYDLNTGFKNEEYIFKDDKVQGPFTRYDNKGNVIAKGHYLDGKIDGIYTEYNVNGQKSRTTPYKNDVIEGVQITYFASGAIFSKQTYKAGKASKTWMTYYESGEQHSEFTFLSTNRFYETQYYKSGKVKLYRTIDQDEKAQGEFVAYFENGNKSLKGNYINGNPDGLITLWHDNGQLKNTAHFEKGELNGEALQYDTDGVLINRSYYSKGKQVGLGYLKELTNPWAFYSNGALVGVLPNAKRSGQWLESPWQDGWTTVANDQYFADVTISPSKAGSQEVYFSLFNSRKNLCFRESSAPEDKIIKIGNQNIKALRWCKKVSSENAYYYNYVAQTRSGQAYVERTFKNASGKVKVTLDGYTLPVPSKGFTKQWNEAGGNAL